MNNMQHDKASKFNKLKLFVCALSLIIVTIAGVKLEERSPLSLSSIIPSFFVSSFKNIPLSPVSVPAIYDLTSINTYKGLPIGKIEQFSVKNAIGTVIYIPQYHKNPGTTSDDPKNDSAQKAQEQIYKILDFLVEKPKVSLIVAEGELYGKVGAEKVMALADKIQKRNTFVNLINQLEKNLKQKSIDQSVEKSLVKKLHQKHDEVDREIALAGAPFVLKAQGKDVMLFGSENQETREESKILVRDYLYLQDRLSQVNNSSLNGNSVSLFDTNGGQGLTNDYKALLNLLSPTVEDSVYRDFSKLGLLSSEKNSPLESLLRKTEDAYKGLDEANKKNVSLSSAVPSRNENPYNSINNKRELQEKIKENEAEIEKVVVEKRNVETAENFAKALKSTNKSIGVLQFGAGHKEGLVKELNKQGLSVIVLTPNEAMARAGRGTS